MSNSSVSFRNRALWAQLICGAFEAAGLGAAEPRQAGASAPAIALISDRGAAGRAADDRIAAHLRGLGRAVAVLDEDDPPPAMGAGALILLSGTVRAHHGTARYRHLAVPI